MGVIFAQFCKYRDGQAPRWRLVRWEVAGGPERFPARIGAGSGLDLPMHSDLVEQEEFVHHSPKFYACALSTRPVLINNSHPFLPV